MNASLAVILIILTILIVGLRARRNIPTGIPALTSLRAIAAALVFFSHYGPVYFFYHTDLLSDLMAGGSVGVPIFFVLSGFLLTLSILTMQPFDIKRYFIKRAARIYPLYYSLLLITFILTPSQVAWYYLILAQGFFITKGISAIPTSWTLSVEECFYALLPILLWTCLKVRWSKIITLVLWWIGLLAVGFLLVALHRPEFLPNPVHMWARSIFGRFPAFGIGIGCAFLYRKRQQWPLGLLFGATVAFLLALHFYVLNDEELVAGPFDFLCAVCTGGIILGLSSKNAVTRFLGNRYFVYLGLISYTLYLIQLSPLMERPANLSGDSLLGVVAVYAIATLMSMFFYEVVEQPARRAILRRFVNPVRGELPINEIKPEPLAH